MIGLKRLRRWRSRRLVLQRRGYPWRGRGGFGMPDGGLLLMNWRMRVPRGDCRRGRRMVVLPRGCFFGGGGVVRFVVRRYPRLGSRRMFVARSYVGLGSRRMFVVRSCPWRGRVLVTRCRPGFGRLFVVRRWGLAGVAARLHKLLLLLFVGESPKPRDGDQEHHHQGGQQHGKTAHGPHVTGTAPRGARCQRIISAEMLEAPGDVDFCVR